MRWTSSRRSLLVLLAAAALPAWAQSTSRVDVVKVMSFSCSVCLASEAHDRLIAAAVRAAGAGRFVSAPIPSREEDTGVRERMYYSARDLEAGFGDAVKTSLYKGVQDRGLELTDFLQVYSWLQQDLPAYDGQMDALLKAAQGQTSAQSVGRAVKLALNAGVQNFPTYIILVNGQVQTALDPSSKNNNLTALRDDVIARVEALSKSSKQ